MEENDLPLVMKRLLGFNYYNINFRRLIIINEKSFYTTN